MNRALPILEGRRFGCTRCGNCCREPGYVYIAYDELEAIAEHLSLTINECREQYEIEWSPEWACWVVDATDGAGCTLLDAESGCRVHPVKPRQCATFPFWPELLEDASVWEKTKTYCPGLDAPKGRLYSKAEIERARDRAAAGSDDQI